MQTYRIEITETLQRYVNIEANSQEEAVNMAYNRHKDGDIVLDENDLVDVEFTT